jgi:hypothetical protein
VADYAWGGLWALEGEAVMGNSHWQSIVLNKFHVKEMKFSNIFLFSFFFEKFSSFGAIKKIEATANFN